MRARERERERERGGLGEGGGKERGGKKSVRASNIKKKPQRGSKVKEKERERERERERWEVRDGEEGKKCVM